MLFRSFARISCARCNLISTAVEEVARALIAAGEIKLHRAQEILAKLVSQNPTAEVS